ncbi:hypothetical protein, partial [Rubrivirga sp.]|uniref:hypothetical protein n=1 Tax=Rubrivirga sp. TaxID=1885344 RepID=UPI003C771205
ARASGAPKPIQASPVEEDVIDLWLGTLAAEQRKSVHTAVLGRMEPKERDELVAARAEKRFAPMPEMAYHVRLRQIYVETTRDGAVATADPSPTLFDG